MRAGLFSNVVVTISTGFDLDGARDIVYWLHDMGLWNLAAERDVSEARDALEKTNRPFVDQTFLFGCRCMVFGAFWPSVLS